MKKVLILMVSSLCLVSCSGTKKVDFIGGYTVYYHQGYYDQEIEKNGEMLVRGELIHVASGNIFVVCNGVKFTKNGKDVLAEVKKMDIDEMQNTIGGDPYDKIVADTCDLYKNDIKVDTTQDMQFTPITRQYGLWIRKFRDN